MKRQSLFQNNHQALNVLFLLRNLPTTGHGSEGAPCESFQIPFHVPLPEHVNQGVDSAVKRSCVEDPEVEEPTPVVQVMSAEEV